MTDRVTASFALVCLCVCVCLCSGRDDHRTFVRGEQASEENACRDGGRLCEGACVHGEHATLAVGGSPTNGRKSGRTRPQQRHL